ncbi:MAG TPA: type II secretion system F family protein [Stellaceae bacterium]|jgi:general secretion pathway protein F
MALYRYQAAAASGELVTGEMDAATQEAVVARLHGLGYIPIRADMARQRAPLRLPLASRLSAPRRHGRGLAFLTQQLAMMLQAGLSLDRALEISQSIVPGKAERECLGAVLDRVRSGSTLADALAAQNGFFPNFYIGMVRAGEAGGSLDTTLRQLAELIERSQAAREHIKSALAYPLVVLATGCGSIAILFGFVIPRFEPLFDDAGASLPTTTRLVLATSDLFRDDWWALAAAALAAILAIRFALRTPTGRRRWHRAILRLPIMGDLVVKIELSRFSRTLGTLLRNGVSPLAALAITQETISNTALRTALGTVMESAKEGKGIAAPLAATGVVPALAVQLTRVGEETARLDEMLLKIGEIYDQETQRSIERLLALLVPGVTIALGVVVAIVMGSIVTAILSVYDLAL